MFGLHKHGRPVANICAAIHVHISSHNFCKSSLKKKKKKSETEIKIDLTEDLSISPQINQDIANLKHFHTRHL